MGISSLNQILNPRYAWQSHIEPERHAFKRALAIPIGAVALPQKQVLTIALALGSGE